MRIYYISDKLDVGTFTEKYTLKYWRRTYKWWHFGWWFEITSDADYLKHWSYSGSVHSVTKKGAEKILEQKLKHVIRERVRNISSFNGFIYGGWKI